MYFFNDNLIIWWIPLVDRGVRFFRINGKWWSRASVLMGTTRGPKGHCRSPEYNQRFKNLISEWNQNQQHFILHVSRSLLCIRFVAITFWAEEVFEMYHLLWWIGQGGKFYSLFGPKNTNLVEDVENLLSVKFRWILFSGFRRKVENVSANKRPGQPFCFFPIGLKNTNVVEGIESLLPVMFRWIPFSGFRGEVENVSANQRPGPPSCFFPIGPKNTNLVEGVEILLPITFRWIRFSGFQRRSRKCLSQSEARAAILFFRSARKTQTW